MSQKGVFYMMPIRGTFCREYLEEQEVQLVCDVCGDDLPEPVAEFKDDRHVEFVTYCKCGVTYTD